jgi:hypothetical protein
MSTERCFSIDSASPASKSRLGVGEGEGDGVDETVGVAVGEVVGVEDALSSLLQATAKTARASAAMKMSRAGKAAVGGP